MKGTLRKLAVLVTPGLSRDLVCESCGNSFSCGASLHGCWCAEVKLSDEDRAGLKGRYGDCLCRECLERIATHPSGVPDR